MRSRVSTKGQITLPARIRHALGLRPGTVVRFEVREGAVLLRKGSGEIHPVDQVYGRLKLGQPVDRLLDEMRGPRPGRRRRSSSPAPGR